MQGFGKSVPPISVGGGVPRFLAAFGGWPDRQVSRFPVALVLRGSEWILKDSGKVLDDFGRRPGSHVPEIVKMGQKCRADFGGEFLVAARFSGLCERR